MTKTGGRNGLGEHQGGNTRDWNGARKRDAVGSQVGELVSGRAIYGASQVALVVRNPLPIQETQETQETQVRSLVQEDPLEEGTAIHSSFLA